MTTTRPDSPLFGTINVTTACNLNCGYCFLQPRSNEHMTRCDFERVVAELSRLSVFFVNISGGEPFVHPEIAELLKIAHDSFRHVLVLSNGTVLGPDHVRAIAEIIKSKGDFTIQVSLDAVTPTVNAMTRCHPKRTIRNLETLTELGAHVVIAMVITNCNAKHIIDSIAALSAYTRYFHLMTVQNVRGVDGIEQRYQLSREEEAGLWQRVHELADQKDLMINTPLTYEGYRGCAGGAPCMAGFSHIVIDPSLKVRPCDRLVDVVIGDLRESTASQIWNGTAVRAIIESPTPFCRLAGTNAPSPNSVESYLPVVAVRDSHLR